MSKKRWVCLSGFLMPVFLSALPSGLEPISGSVTVSLEEEGVMRIEAEDRAIIRYHRFRIGEGEKVRFIQPNASSCVLNRVIGEDPSEILGTMKGNGQIFLVNPNGIYFGPNAEVDVGSLIASTLDIKEQDFLDERLSFLDEGGKSIVNQGNLQAEESIVLLSSTIRNEGSIVAKLGKVLLASGEKVCIDFEGTGLVSFAVEGELEEALIEQAGSIEALQGEVYLRMSHLQESLKQVVNVDGIAFGERLIEENGVIYLTAGSNIESGKIDISAQKGSKIIVDGVLDASSPLAKGGEIKLSAESVVLGKALLKSTGDLGGGVIDVHASSSLRVGSDSILTVDALFKGDGGRILVHSDGEVFFEGRVFARGGSAGGEMGRCHLEFPEMTIGNGEGLILPSVIESSIAHVSLSGGEGFIRVIDPIAMSHTEVGITLTGKTVYLNEGISTKGGAIEINSSFTALESGVKLDTTGGGAFLKGGDIEIVGPVEGAYKLILDGGSQGVLTIGGHGAGLELASILMKGKGIELYTDMNATGGTIIFDGPVRLMNDLSLTDVGPTGIVFLDTLDSFGGTRSLALNAPRGRVSFLGDVGNQLPLENLTITSYRIELKENISLAGTLEVNGPLALLGDVEIKALAMDFLGPVDGSYNLALNGRNSGTIALRAVLGQEVRLNDVLFLNANSLTVEGIYAETISQSNVVASIYNSFLDTTGSGGISLQGDTFTFLGSIQASNGGGFSIDNAGAILGGPDLEIAVSGPFIQMGAGSIALSGTLETRGSPISFAGPLTLNGPLSLGSGGRGSIQFAEFVDGGFSLDLTLGIGDLLFSKAIGLTDPLGDVLLHSARNVETRGIHAASYTQEQGYGLAFYNGNIITTGDLAINITSNYLKFAGRSRGRVLQTKLGNIIVNAVYGGINKAGNPVEVNISEGEGTLFVGGAFPGYFSSKAHAVEKIGSVRSNVPCFVEYNGDTYYPTTTPISVD